jgi:hypothetical protein
MAGEIEHQTIEGLLHEVNRDVVPLFEKRLRAGVSNDIRADNVIVEVEFGDVAGELVGHGIVRCLSLINNLEVNEQVLYARMINVEESTLIE